MGCGEFFTCLLCSGLGPLHCGLPKAIKNENGSERSHHGQLPFSAAVGWAALPPARGSPTSRCPRFQVVRAGLREGLKGAPEEAGTGGVPAPPPDPRGTRRRTGWGAGFSVPGLWLFLMLWTRHPLNSVSLPLNRNFHVIRVRDGFYRAPTLLPSSPWWAEGPLWPPGSHLACFLELGLVSWALEFHISSLLGLSSLSRL